MADIRRLQSDRYDLSVGDASMPAVRVGGVGTANTAVAQGVGALGQGIQQLAAMSFQKQEEFDRLTAEDANNRLSQALLDLVSNPERGMLNARKGVDAIGKKSVSRDFGRRSLQIKDSIIKTMGLNERQKELFEYLAQTSHHINWS